jgi:hypothetical protein
MSQLISALKKLILQTPDLTRCSRFLAGSAFQLAAENITGRAARPGAFQGATRWITPSCSVPAEKITVCFTHEYAPGLCCAPASQALNVGLVLCLILFPKQNLLCD